MRQWMVASALAAGLIAGGAQAQQRIAPETWISAADYPASAATHDDEGSVRMTLSITVEGRVERCRVEYATAPDELAAFTCRLIEQRSRYVPRHEAPGRPVTGRDVLMVRWHSGPVSIEIPAAGDFGGAVPASPPPAWATDLDYPDKLLKGRDADVSIAYAIGADGRVSDCDAVFGSAPQLAEHLCGLVSQRARFEMPLDEQGAPIATRARSTFYWRRR